MDTDGRDNNSQFLYQVLALALTLGVAGIGGFLTGKLINACTTPVVEYGEDAEIWGDIEEEAMSQQEAPLLALGKTVASSNGIVEMIQNTDKKQERTPAASGTDQTNRLRDGRTVVLCCASVTDVQQPATGEGREGTPYPAELEQQRAAPVVSAEQRQAPPVRSAPPPGAPVHDHET